MHNVEEIKEILELFDSIIERRDPPKIENVKGKQVVSFMIYLKDGSMLKTFNSLFLLTMKSRYSYQWMRADKSLIIRWDDAPHTHQVATMPHHQHLGTEENVQPSEEMNLRKVLAFILKTMAVVLILGYGLLYFFAEKTPQKAEKTAISARNR
jgi:Family of unknown function (DUF6516)